MSSYPAPRTIYDTFSTETLPDKYEANGVYSQFADYVTEPAQGAITSLGTLNELQIDNVNINGNTIKSDVGEHLYLDTTSGLRKIIANSDLEMEETKRIRTNHIQSLTAGDLTIENSNTGQKIYLLSNEVYVSSVLTVSGDVDTTYNIKAQRFAVQNEITTEGGTANLNINTNLIGNVSLNNSTIYLNSDVVIDSDKLLKFSAFEGRNFRSFIDGTRYGILLHQTENLNYAELRFQQYNQPDQYGLSSTWDFSFQYSNGTLKLLTINNTNTERAVFSTTSSTFTIGESGFPISSSFYGNTTIYGTLSKSAGTFSIPHPLPEKKDTHLLRHSFVEAPRMDNIYRDTIRLIDGKAIVNLDIHFKMTEGTFVLLNRDCSVITSNEETWAHIRGKVEGNILTIECENPLSTTLVSYMVIGERCDDFVKTSTMTDDDGNFLPEILSKE